MKSLLFPGKYLLRGQCKTHEFDRPASLKEELWQERKNNDPSKLCYAAFPILTQFAYVCHFTGFDITA